MKPTLVFTADDFGLHPSINKGIIKLSKKGIVDQASFVVGTKYFKKSAQQLKKNPRLGVGIHLNLTDGMPVSEREKIPTLVNKKGKFIGGRHYAVVLNLLLGRFDIRQVREEWGAQIEKAQKAGLTIKFINSHGHIHLLPVLHSVVMDLAKKYNVKTVRVALNGRGVKGFILKIFSLIFIAKIKSRKLNIKYPEQVLGIDYQGHLNKKLLKEELKRTMIAEKQEFIVHPASSNNVFHKQWGYDTREEFTALSSLS